MSKYAIVQLQGKQHKVAVGDTLIVDRLEAEAGKKYEVTDVLLVSDGKESKIGTPVVKDAKVTFKVLTHEKGEKIRVAKYKSKSRYRRVQGHRQLQSTLEVVEIAA